MQFENQIVAEKYEATREDDTTVHLGKYHGKLSRITEDVAKKLIDVKDPNIKEREIKKTVAVTAPAATKQADK